MKQTVIILAALLCICLVAGIPLENASTRVFGGKDVKLGEYPFMASLRMYDQPFCGGSIISNRFVLTAGHCVINQKVDLVKVHVGTNSWTVKGDVYNVEQLIPHEKYVFARAGYDIGLIKVARDFDFSNKNIRQVLLHTNFVPGDKVLTAMGFGRSEEPQKMILQQLDMVSLEHSACRAKQYILTEELCAYTSPTQGVCHGDSGSPIIFKGQNSQVGIAARVQVEGCIKGHPDMFTRLNGYIDWIIAHAFTD